MNEVQKKRERMSSSLLKQKSGSIELRSYHGKSTHKRRVQPMKNASGTWYKGVPKITQDMRDSGEPFVDPMDMDNPLSNVVLEHQMLFNLANDDHRKILGWLFELDKVLAMDYEEGLSNKHQTFYVYNEILDRKTRMDKYEIKDSAVSTLKKLTDSNLKKVVRLMGMRANDDIESLRLRVRESFEDNVRGYKNAGKFLEVIDDTNKDIKYFAQQAVDAGVVKLDASKGIYYYNETPLGTSFDAYWSNLVSKDFADITAAIAQEARLQIPGTKKTVRKTTSK